MGKRTIKISGYEQAERIMDNFSKNERWLRNVIANVTGDGTYADGLNYSALLHQANIIKGVARRMLKSRVDVARLDDMVEPRNVLENSVGVQLYLFN